MMPATFGITMVRNEIDVIAGVLTHMADEVDHLIVMDNGSTDGTREVIAALDLPMTVFDDYDPAYYQSVKMSRLAAVAGRRGATWIVPFDADELWTDPRGRLRDVFAQAPDTVTSCRATLYNHFRTALDLPDPDPFRSMVWRATAPGALPKIAFRYQENAVIHQGNHGVDLPAPNTTDTGTTIRHFMIRSPEQFETKVRQGAAAYAATTLPEDQGAHWRSWGRLLDAGGPRVLRQVYNQHYYYLSPTDSGLVRNPAPYQRWRT
jgi:glycosyltransferase involved in cell wall biosynthesis